MKKLIFKKLLLAAIVLPMVFVGCKKDDDDDDTKPKSTSNKPFAFVLDGKAQDYSKNVSLVSLGPDVQIIGMKEMSSPSNRLTIFIADSVELGVHEFTKSMVTANYVVENDSNTTYYHAIDGQVNIKSYDKKKESISGTFYFTGENPKSKETVAITSGQFNIK